MTVISTLPSPPTRDDPASFNDRADTFFAALPNFVIETNLVASQVSTNATQASASATAAASSVAAAAAAAGAPIWVSGNSYSQGAVVYDNVNFQTYRKITTTNTSATTRPALNANDWTLLTGSVDIDSKQELSNKLYIAPREKRIALASGTINVNTGSVFTFTATANTNFVFNLPSNIATDEVMCFVLELNRATFNITFPSSVKWSFGLQPALTQSGVDILGFYTYTNGSTWRGSVIARNVS